MGREPGTTQKQPPGVASKASQSGTENQVVTQHTSGLDLLTYW